MAQEAIVTPTSRVSSVCRNVLPVSVIENSIGSFYQPIDNPAKKPFGECHITGTVFRCRKTMPHRVYCGTPLFYTHCKLSCQDLARLSLTAPSHICKSCMMPLYTCRLVLTVPAMQNFAFAAGFS
jgi:hypothetical protein